MVGLRSDIESKLVAKKTDFLVQAIRISWAILFLSICYQLIFFSDITNLIAMAAVVLVWFIATKIWLRPEMLNRYLLSSFMLLGFVLSQFYFPVVFTTIENKPVIYNLELPEQVFLHSSLCFLVLVVAHATYRFAMRYSFNRSFSILGKAGFFDPPSHLQLWIMGAIGMASSIYVYLMSPDVGQEAGGDTSGKLLQGLVPFTYAPFFIPFSKIFGNDKKPPKGFTLVILGYAVLLFVVSMARNSRGAFIVGLTSPAFAYGLGLLLGVFKTRVFTIKNFVIVGFVLWLLTGPFTDLGTAMLIVRGTRQDIPPTELITLTLETLDDEKAIEARKRDDRSESMDFDWDERYLDNIFTARFSNIKFNDSNLITYSKVGPYDPDMQDYSFDHLIAASFPEPIIKMLNLDVDKELVLSLSFGDFLYVVSGGYGTPEGYRVGHVAGTGMATFGWWYLLLLGIVMLPIFYFVDKFFRRKKRSELATLRPSENEFRFSFCGVLALTSFFQFLLFESVIHGMTYLTRDWWQRVILYFVLFHLSRLISTILAGPRRHLRLDTKDLPKTA